MLEITQELRVKVIRLLAEERSIRWICRYFGITRRIVEIIVEEDLKSFTPAYDPYRDGERPFDSLSAAILGDPPIGRRALDLEKEKERKVSLVPV